MKIVNRNFQKKRHIEVVHCLLHLQVYIEDTPGDNTFRVEILKAKVDREN